MGRGALVFLGGGALGAVVGATVAAVIVEAGVPASPAVPLSDPDHDLARLGRTFEDALARALRRVQAERAPGHVAGGDRATEAPVPPPEPGGAAALGLAAGPGSPVSVTVVQPSTAHDSSGAYVQDESAPLPPKNQGRVDALFVRSRGALERRRRDWMFQSEAALARTLGVPDEVNVEKNGTETWDYEYVSTGADGESRVRALTFRFWRGRVIEVDGAADIPDE